MTAEVRVCQRFSYTTYDNGYEGSKTNKQITLLGKKKKRQIINFLKWDLIFRPGGISSDVQRKKTHAVHGTCVPIPAKPMGSLPVCTQAACPPVFPAI